jgi:hypothetical protein
LISLAIAVKSLKCVRWLRSRHSVQRRSHNWLGMCRSWRDEISRSVSTRSMRRFRDRFLNFAPDGTVTGTL